MYIKAVLNFVNKLVWLYILSVVRAAIQNILNKSIIPSFSFADVLFEVPANIVLKRTSPQAWLPTITLIWGVVSVCQGLVVNKAGFYAVRFILGATEAGLFPGVIYVFSMYYTRTQRSIRVSFFFSGSALAGAFGGVLAYLLGLINGGGKPGWAWIFIVEGLITIAVSFLAYFLVPSWPQHASFLTEPEKERLLSRLRRDTDSADLEPFTWKGVQQALTDPLSYLYALLFHGGAFTMYSISLFLPTIIANLGFATWKAQVSRNEILPPMGHDA